MSYAENTQVGSLPRPGKVLTVVLLGIFAVWLAFAVGLNWAGASPSVFLALAGNTERVLHGEVWRLFTAPWLHAPVGSWGHVASALIGLYFLAPNLEARWGGPRFARFLLLAALCGYGLQMLADVLLPGSLGIGAPDGYWYGAIPVVEAVAIAWALSFRGQIVRLFFVLPVTSTGLIVIVIAMSVMAVIIREQGPSGLVAPFGGMLAGWLFGGSSPSPFRRLWLKLRLAQLDVEAKREARDRRKRAEKSGLRVISGGRDDDGDDEKKPKSGSGDRWLN